MKLQNGDEFGIKWFNLVEIVYGCGYQQKNKYFFLCIKYFRFDKRSISFEALRLDTESISGLRSETYVHNSRYENFAKHWAYTPKIVL